MKEKLLKIIKHYGLNHQQRKLEEEVYELQEAITRYEMARETNSTGGVYSLVAFEEHIVEEIADVCVLLMQITNYFKIDVPSIDKIMEMKIDRQIERIENEKHN